MQAQVNEPVEIFQSPMIIAYHFCQWNEGEVLLNANVLGDGRYIIRMDEDGHDLEMDRWHLTTNSCSFLTESKFFTARSTMRTFLICQVPAQGR